MTMSDLAKIANVSVSTVSKAFGNAKDVNPETKQRILEIAKEYGCYGKFKKEKYFKNTVAIICPEIISGYYGDLVNMLTSKIEAQKGLVMVAVDSFDSQKQAELIEYFASYVKVDGMIVIGLKSEIKKGYAIPIISISGIEDNLTENVNITFDEAVGEAVSLLKGMGHKNIAFLGEALTLGKANAFKKAAISNFINDDYVFTSNLRFEKAGEDCVEKMLAATKSCTAAICAYDNIAYGVIKRLSKEGIRVPEDFSVIGFDNLKTSNYTETALSTIDLNSEEVSEKVCDLLFKKIKNKYYKSKDKILVHGNLIVRESVENIKKGDGKNESKNEYGA